MRGVQVPESWGTDFNELINYYLINFQGVTNVDWGSDLDEHKSMT
jgi:hypothetical protein